VNVLSHRISTGLSLALALGAIAAPVAQARFDLNPTATPVTASAAPAVRVVHVANSSGFDWGDAGIGAGGMVGLIAIAVGATLAAGGRRSRSSSTRPARAG
jgi:hypothetical protein